MKFLLAVLFCMRSAGLLGLVPDTNEHPVIYNANLDDKISDALWYYITNTNGFSDVKFTVNKGKVVLTGTVGSEKAKTEIELRAKSIIGVDSVKNKIKVKTVY
jgi:hypothetical protein